MVRSHIRSDRPADSLFATGVHEQLRELAFSKRVKMHALIMEGLDTVFPARGLRSVADLTNKGRYPCNGMVASLHRSTMARRAA